MRTILIPALLASLLAGAAFAQTPPSAADGTPAAAMAAAPGAGGPAAGPGRPLPPAPGDDADAGPVPPPPPGPGPGGRRGPPPPPPGAHIHLQRGDAVIDVQCAANEPTKSCADTVMQMLDRVQPAAKP